MIVGSVHFAEFLELLFWLREVGYDGWYSMDQYPYREDGQAAIRSSVEFLRGLETMLDGSMDELRAVIASGTRSGTRPGSGRSSSNADGSARSGK